MVIGTLADTLGRGIEGITNGVSAALFEPVIRLGVTGLSRAGKTVFITSFVANLLDPGRMVGLEAARAGRIEAAFLRPQRDDTMPRFDYETHLAAMTGQTPQWPVSTRGLSELRLSLRFRPKGLLAGLSGARTLHIDIVDYPGEWLLDLGLLDLDFAAWSAQSLRRAETRAEAGAYLDLLNTIDPAARFDQSVATTLAGTWTAYLRDARAAGYSDATPDRPPNRFD